MKFKMISEKDVKAIREARKALTRIAKKTKKLCDAETDALGNQKKEWKPIALKCWRMLDEVDALGLSEGRGQPACRDIRIRLEPSGDAKRWFPL